jgi:hypothetical protein
MARAPTNPPRPEIGQRYRVRAYASGAAYVVTVTARDARYVYGTDDQRHPLRWSRAAWRAAQPEPAADAPVQR